MKELTNDQIRQNVRTKYKEIALSDQTQTSCCATNTTVSSCCEDTTDHDTRSAMMGYSDQELSSVPTGANLGLGCGNPQAIADMKRGEVVLDLGSGAGFDCFLASRQVGESGLVIGVDMTPEMISKARTNADKGKFENTQFRLGEIEHLPVADNTVDVIISNCVVNLSPDKQQVFNESYRVLRPDGRIAISDIVTTATLPTDILNDLDAYSSCVSGASSVEEIRNMLTLSGFINIVVQPKDESREFIKDWVPGANVDDYIVSAIIQAVKPRD